MLKLNASYSKKVPAEGIFSSQNFHVSCIHRYFKQWLAAGFFSALFEKGLANWPEMQGIAWHWQPDASNGQIADDGKNPYAHRAWCPVYKQRRPRKRKSAKRENAKTLKQSVHITQESEDASNSLQEPALKKLKGGLFSLFAPFLVFVQNGASCQI